MNKNIFEVRICLDAVKISLRKIFPHKILPFLCGRLEAILVSWTYFNIVDLCGIMPYKSMYPQMWYQNKL